MWGKLVTESERRSSSRRASTLVATRTRGSKVVRLEWVAPMCERNHVIDVGCDSGAQWAAYLARVAVAL